eukprot:CAMPEP_0177647914 /NCGR_PEP_ID=MMETSP0447-20121125/10551_1 /TAXON_ID=0 /ORGANISM="Stygamoeba regulata, Strain BSH-02190019" /LENGTH=228 /DNA_ID=CAMNT_0019150525 /DNA_START=200 /DNA_END=886 /DNA_ORIENTATION=-
MEVYPSAAAPLAHRGERGWSPYVDNGGTALGIAGEDFCVIAADTRVSNGYMIHTRNQGRIFKLTDKTYLASAGMLADVTYLRERLLVVLTNYKHQHGSLPSTTALAQLLSNLLYSRRFFPLYTQNLLVGIDNEGKGCVFTYDSIGNFEKTHCASQGSGQPLIIPFLDNQLGWKGNARSEKLTREFAVELTKEAFTSAGERDIHTGDSVEIILFDAKGATSERFALKED